MNARSMKMNVPLKHMATTNWLPGEPIICRSPGVSALNVPLKHMATTNWLPGEPIICRSPGVSASAERGKTIGSCLPACRNVSSYQSLIGVLYSLECYHI